MIFVDANIPMYLVGDDNEFKQRARAIVSELISDHARLVTDAEVLQEILHRYSAIRRRTQIQPAFDALLALVDEVFDVTRDDIDLARTYVLAPRGMRARDAVHRAVMARRDITQIVTFDRHFRNLHGIVCLPDPG